MIKIEIKRIFQEMGTEYVSFGYGKKGSDIEISKPNKDGVYTRIHTPEELKDAILEITKHAPELYKIYYRDDVLTDKEGIEVSDNFDELLEYMKRLLKQKEVDAVAQQLEEEGDD